MIIPYCLLGSREGDGSAEDVFTFPSIADAICVAKFDPELGCRPTLSCILVVALLLNLFAILFNEVTFGNPEFDRRPLLLPYFCRI